ncbi:hypothetical protein FRB99_004142, partial [Tulasnella sp. 403]
MSPPDAGAIPQYFYYPDKQTCACCGKILTARTRARHLEKWLQALSIQVRLQNHPADDPDDPDDPNNPSNDDDPPRLPPVSEPSNDMITSPLHSLPVSPQPSPSQYHIPEPRSPSPPSSDDERRRPFGNEEWRRDNDRPQSLGSTTLSDGRPASNPTSEASALDSDEEPLFDEDEDDRDAEARLEDQIARRHWKEQQRALTEDDLNILRLFSIRVRGKLSRELVDEL